MAVGAVGSSHNNIANLKISSDPYEKMKLSIENQIKKVENGKESRELKDKKIKELRETLKQIQDQENQEKVQKNKEAAEKAAEAKESKDEEVDDSKSPEEKKSAAVNKKVVKGLIGTSSHMKTAKVANKYYEEYKLQGNTDKMRNALKYVSAELKEVSKSEKLIKKGLNEYNKQVQNAKKSETSNDKDSAKVNDKDGIKVNDKDGVKINDTNNEKRDIDTDTKDSVQSENSDLQQNSSENNIKIDVRI